MKFARRWALNARAGGRARTRVVFIMGAQRSGTRLPMIALERAPDVLTYREGARPYFDGVRLQRDDTLERLVGRCRFPTLVLKPLCDSHRARHLLQRFPDSRVIWIFRGYQDTIRSASLKWNSGPDAVERIVSGRLSPDDWRSGGLTEEALAVARRLYRPGLGLHHANAILWYLRTRLILDLDLFECPSVLIVSYEDLSTDPRKHFPRMFSFLGEPFRPACLHGIHGNPVRRPSLPGIPAPVDDTCEGLFTEIARRYRLAVNRTAQPT